MAKFTQRGGGFITDFNTSYKPVTCFAANYLISGYGGNTKLKIIIMFSTKQPKDIW